MYRFGIGKSMLEFSNNEVNLKKFEHRIVKFLLSCQICREL